MGAVAWVVVLLVFAVLWAFAGFRVNAKGGFAALGAVIVVVALVHPDALAVIPRLAGALIAE